MALRTVHPCWGAELIRIYLEDQGIPVIPCARTLQRWFQRFGLGPAPAGRKPPADRRASHPHDIWQVDAAEEIALANGQRVSWLRVVDEFSGAVLHTAIFPLGCWNSVPATSSRDELRCALGRWGIPKSIRVDNGSPWGSTGELPTDLSLWLIGWGRDGWGLGSNTKTA